MSTYLPRACGLAAFTGELGRVVPDREVVALQPPDERLAYGIEVHHRIRRDEPSDYTRIAASVSSCVDAVSVQFHPLIWGGEDGDTVLDFLGGLRVPGVVTLHHVASEPTPRQHDLVRAVAQGARTMIVMSRLAARRLVDVYGIEPARIALVPHGAPDVPQVDAESVKAGLDLEGRTVLVSVGFVSPGKGYEHVLRALPAILREHPAVTYVIAGTTHPDGLRGDGPAYRRSLEALAADAGIERNVRFIDRFLGRVELVRLLQAADIIVAPQWIDDRVASGALASGLAAGRAIVSAADAYATELLGDGRGVLIEVGPPKAFASALAAAIGSLIDDPERRVALGRRSYEASRDMTWSRIGAAYQELLSLPSGGPAAAPADARRGSLPA